MSSGLTAPWIRIIALSSCHKARRTRSRALHLRSDAHPLRADIFVAPENDQKHLGRLYRRPLRLAHHCSRVSLSIHVYELSGRRWNAKSAAPLIYSTPRRCFGVEGSERRPNDRCGAAIWRQCRSEALALRIKDEQQKSGGSLPSNIWIPNGAHPAGWRAENSRRPALGRYELA